MVPLLLMQVLILELILEDFQKVLGFVVDAAFLTGSLAGGMRQRAPLDRRLIVGWICRRRCSSSSRMRSSGVASNV